MLKQLLFILIILLLAACAQRRDQDLKGSVEDKRSGLFFLTDSLQGQLVKEDLRFNQKGYAFIQQEPILPLSELDPTFFYDTVIAADTFALVSFQRIRSIAKPSYASWQACLANTRLLLIMKGYPSHQNTEKIIIPGMLSIGLSLNGGLRLLERALKMRVEGMGKALLEGVYTEAPKAVAVTETIALDAPGLRIARTILPDRQMDFNQTFKHIYQELKSPYMSAADAPSGNYSKEFVRRPLVSQWAGERSTHKAAIGLNVSRTAMPDQQLDFNQTFRHIHMELKAGYQRAAQGL